MIVLRSSFMNNVKYVKCPYCDINYMKSTQERCDVCEALRNGKLGADDEEDDRMLCPVCNKNYIELDEEMCAQCLSEREEVVVSPETDEEWRAYLDDDKDIAIPADEMEISMSELEAEEEEEEEEADDLVYPADDLVDVLDDFDI